MISRPALQHFLLRMHQDDGSYIMHEDGEKDIRSVIGSKIVLGFTLLRRCRGSKDRYQVMCCFTALCLFVCWRLLSSQKHQNFGINSSSGG